VYSVNWNRDSVVFVPDRRIVGAVLFTALTACEPAISGTAQACYAIDEAAYRAAIASGAAAGTGTLNNAGISTLSTSGTTYCRRYRGHGSKRCIRPVDFVIKYTVADESVRYVRVPAGVPHRFNTNARPTPCELIIEDGAAS
jgi:hypothetical protein